MSMKSPVVLSSETDSGEVAAEPIITEAGAALVSMWL
jgi:hypothetical protein